MRNEEVSNVMFGWLSEEEAQRFSEEAGKFGIDVRYERVSGTEQVLLSVYLPYNSSMDPPSILLYGTPVPAPAAMMVYRRAVELSARKAGIPMQGKNHVPIPDDASMYYVFSLGEHNGVDVYAVVSENGVLFAGKYDKGEYRVIEGKYEEFMKMLIDRNRKMENRYLGESNTARSWMNAIQDVLNKNNA